MDVFMKQSQLVSKSAKKNSRKQNQKRQGRQRSLFSESSTAASYDVSVSSPTRFSIRGEGVKHSEYGSAVRVEGSQEFLTLATTSSNSNLISGGNAVGAGTNGCTISPYNFGDRLALFGSIYQRYAFRELEFIFITRVGTEQVGSMVMAYSTDGGYLLNGITPTYASTQDLEPAQIFPFRKEADGIRVKFTGERTWYTDPSTDSGATAEGNRQCYQGVLALFPDQSSIGTIPMGEIYVRYVIDFYVPNSIQQTVALRSLGLPKEFSEALIKRLRNSPKEDFKRLLERMESLLKDF